MTDDPLEPIDDTEDTQQGSDDNATDSSITEKWQAFTSPSEPRESLGGTVAYLLALPLIYAGGTAKNFLNASLLLFTRYFPRGHKLWPNVIKAGFKNYKKSSGADVINLVARPNQQIDPVPCKWSPADGEDNKSKWISKDGSEEWGAGAEGRGTEFIGQCPTILSAERSREVGSVLQNRVAEAVDMGQTDRLYTQPEFTKIEIQDPGGATQARADGGVSKQHWDIRQEDPGYLSDVLVELDSNRVSWTKYDELYHETTTTEEMKNQEQRGKLAAMDPGERRRFALKMMMIGMGGALAIVAIVFLGPEIVNALFGNGGGGGGGGGSPIPPI